MRQAGVLHNSLERMCGTKLQQQQQLVEWKKANRKTKPNTHTKVRFVAVAVVVCIAHVGENRMKIIIRRCADVIGKNYSKMKSIITHCRTLLAHTLALGLALYDRCHVSDGSVIPT